MKKAFYIFIITIVLFPLSVFSYTQDDVINEWAQFIEQTSSHQNQTEQWVLDFKLIVPSSGSEGTWIPRAKFIKVPWFFSIKQILVSVTPFSRGWITPGIGTTTIGDWMVASLQEQSNVSVIVAVANQKHDAERTVIIRLIGNKGL